MKMPPATATTPSRMRSERGDSPRRGGEAAQHEHEEEHGEGLDRELGEGEVGSPEEEEHDRDAVAHDAQRGHREEERRVPDDRHRPRHHREGDRRLTRPHRVEAERAAGPRASRTRSRRGRPSCRW